MISEVLSTHESLDYYVARQSPSCLLGSAICKEESSFEDMGYEDSISSLIKNTNCFKSLQHLKTRFQSSSS